MQKQNNSLKYKLDFELEKSRIKDFLINFTDKTIKEEDRIHGRIKYLIELQKIANKKQKILTINTEDLEDYFFKDEDFYKMILTNIKRYMKIFYDVTAEIMPSRTSQATIEEIEPIQEVIMNQRMSNLSLVLNDNSNINNEKSLSKYNQIPNELLRR
jgi:hypothetical protein